MARNKPQQGHPEGQQGARGPSWTDNELVAYLSGSLAAVCLADFSDHQLNEIVANWIGMVNRYRRGDNSEWVCEVLNQIYSVVAADPDPSPRALARRMLGLVLAGQWQPLPTEPRRE
jgi:hypothetical protein